MATKVDFERLKKTIPLEQVLNHYHILNTLTPAKLNSSDLRGRCPLPECTGERSFYAYTDNRFHCFKCTRSGTVIDFVMLMENLDARAAAFKLQDWFLNPPTTEASHTKKIEEKDIDPASHWRTDLKLLWNLLDELDAPSDYYDALGRLEDIITTYGPWVEAA